MNRFAGICCLTVFSMAGLFALSGIAEAGNFKIVNRAGVNVTVVVKYYDYKKKSWWVKGWWSVDAGNTRTIGMNNAPDRKIFYYIKQVGGKKIWNGDKSSGQAIISKKMDHKYDVLKTYADSYNVKMGGRETDQNGNYTLTLNAG